MAQRARSPTYPAQAPAAVLLTLPDWSPAPTMILLVKGGRGGRAVAAACGHRPNARPFVRRQVAAKSARFETQGGAELGQRDVKGEVGTERGQVGRRGRSRGRGRWERGQRVHTRKLLWVSAGRAVLVPAVPGCTGVCRFCGSGRKRPGVFLTCERWVFG